MSEITILSFFITCLAYVFIPVLIVSAKSKSSQPFTYRKLKILITINAICVYIIACFIRVSLGDYSVNTTPAFFWSILAYWLIRGQCVPNDSVEKKKVNDKPQTNSESLVLKQNVNIESKNEKFIDNKPLAYSNLGFKIAITVLSTIVVALGFAYYNLQQQVSPLTDELTAATTKLTETEERLQMVIDSREHYKSQVENAQRQKDAAQAKWRNVIEEYNDFYNRNSKLLTEWFDYNKGFAFTTTPYGNAAYHRPSCNHLGERAFLVIIQEAEERGYYPCSDCYKPVYANDVFYAPSLAEYNSYNKLIVPY